MTYPWAHDSIENDPSFFFNWATMMASMKCKVSPEMDSIVNETSDRDWEGKEKGYQFMCVYVRENGDD